MSNEAETLFSSNTQKEDTVWHAYLLIGLLSVVILGSMGYGFWSGNNMIAGQEPLIDAAMEIKLEATSAHLWLEEIISGDRHEDFDAVMEHIAKADWYARVMLEGGENSEGVFSPLKDKTLHREILEVREKIARFKQMTLERWDDREAAGVGTDIDQEHDRVFRSLIAQADRVETGIQQTITRQLRNFQILQGTLIGVCILVTIVVALAIGRLLHRHIKDKASLNSMNQQLNATNQQLIAREQQLSAANQQLTAHEQQLLAINQQLRSGEQQLLAANQQLNANNQHLRASEQHLKSMNQQLESEIFERERTEQALELARKEADIANTAKSQFLANMSHEIRTPMNAIIGFSEILADEDLPDEQRERVGIIRESGKNLLTIINDILDFSKIEAGQLDVEIVECSLGQLLNSLESLMRPKAKEKELDFEVVESGGLPEQIRTDPTRLHQCLVNLVGNAVKFTEKGHVHMKVALQEHGDKAFIHFDIVDTGIGIDQDKQELIFDSFIQADGDTTRKYGGTGLGLAITKQLAELLGGQLTVTSEKGKGSVFSLRIPAGVDVTKQFLLNRNTVVSHKDSRQQKPKQTEYSGNVLVAEDVKTNQMLITSLLKRVGLQVTIVEDGNEAVQKTLTGQFDLIFMDIQMPNMNGYEATEALRKEGISTPIIALTANAMKGDEKKCIEAGCDGYLAKPIDRRELLKTIARYLSANAEALSEPCSGQKVVARATSEKMIPLSDDDCDDLREFNS